MKICAYIFLLFILFSCASRKQTDKRMTSDVRLDILEDLSQQKSSEYRQIDWNKFIESLDLDISITRYDTKVNPDSIGKYPIAEETKIKLAQKTQSDQKTEKQDESKEKTITNSTYTGQSNTDEKIISTATTDVAGGNNILWVFVPIGICAGIILLIKFSPKK